MKFDRFANLKYKYGNRHFWTRVFFADTVKDKLAHQMSMKEFIDPFMGEEVVREGK